MKRRSRQETASGIAALEGYLLAQAEISDARREAEAFADRLPWLTSAERAEVVRLYSAERLELSRRFLRRVTERSHELRAQYSARYEQLRRRVLCTGAGLLLGAVGLCVLGAVMMAAAGR